ncbi:MAG: methyltransferase domain-containing protein [Myxococcales bacterium]|nr:methyltransferase domain-containing protein [Myxococcales bacterium]
MRVVDLDRDMRDVVPTGTTRDSEYLFERMTRRTLDLARPGCGTRLLDVASGFGQDAIALSRRGSWAVGTEPSRRMSGFARLQSERASDRPPSWVRSWSSALPFRDGSFDGVICKGALDHFDRPLEAIAEMARVTRREGRVVLAIANFESLSCRVARGLDSFKEGWLRRSLRRGRRHYDVPSDHFTRYEIELMREQAREALEIDVVEGISMAWGLPGWSRLLGRLPAPLAQLALNGLGRMARLLPGLSDVVILAGRPRRVRKSSMNSA